VLQTKGKKGWFWYIPLHDDIVSVGIVRGFDEMFAGNRDHEAIYNGNWTTARRSSAGFQKRRAVTSIMPQGLQLQGQALFRQRLGLAETLMDFSTPCIPPVCCWPLRVDHWRRTPWSRDWPAATPPRNAWQVGSRLC